MEWSLEQVPEPRPDATSWGGSTRRTAGRRVRVRLFLHMYRHKGQLGKANTTGFSCLARDGFGEPTRDAGIVRMRELKARVPRRHAATDQKFETHPSPSPWCAPSGSFM